MAKTYSELLVVIAQRDLAIAKLKAKIERDSREFHETYMTTLDSHTRDLASISYETRESLREKENQIEYWQGEVVKARRERDELYKRDDNWREELKLANDRIARLKGENNELRLQIKKLTPEKEFIELLDFEDSPETPYGTRESLTGETPDLIIDGRGYTSLGWCEDSPETLEDSPLTGEDSPETPKGWDSI